PLTATTADELLLTRQVNEPLVEQLTGPLGDGRSSRGLARSWSSSRDDEVWSFRLRSGVRFQDGTRFNPSAVLVNAERWRTTVAGRRLLANLSAVDAPRPDLVRFFLAAPDRSFPRRLADPRLGLVSPTAL